MIENEKQKETGWRGRRQKQNTESMFVGEKAKLQHYIPRGLQVKYYKHMTK